MSIGRKMIDSYDFGRIVIDGKPYDSDVIIHGDGRISSWWRKEGHKLQESDIKEIIEEMPQILIVGTGYSGVMKVPQGTKAFIESKGIKLLVERTEDACTAYNKLKGSENVVAALHLTC